MDSTDLKALPSETVTDESDNASAFDIDVASLPTSSPDSMLVLDRHIQHAAFYNPKPPLLRLDVLPFLLLYSLLIFLAAPALHYEIDVAGVAAVSASPVTPAALLPLVKNDTEDDDLLSASSSFTEEPAAVLIPAVPAPPSYHFYAMYLLPVLALLHGLTFLSAFWSIRINTALRYTQVHAAPLSAQVIRILPALHCGAPALCPTQRAVIDGAETHFFVFQKTKYIYSPAASSFPACFVPLSYPTALPVSSYLRSSGLSASPAAVESALSKYGPNVFDIPLPLFMELYVEHAMAPFFLFQVFCVLLWCLDEYWYYSLMTLFMLVSFEATVVKRRLKHLEYVRDMRQPAFRLFLHRDQGWEQRLSSDILPGDLVSMTRTGGDSVCPCDLLILSGQAVVNEALLTGESVPQVKEPVDLSEGDVALAMGKQHKRHVLYGGTKVLMTSHKEAGDEQQQVKLAVKPAPDGGCVCYALKTGFASGQGKLVRTILYSTERVSVNNTESLLFILFLLVFAVLASGYVLYHGLQEEGRSRYKLLLNCVDEDTPVTMADGTRRRIKHVRPGDVVLAYHRQRGGAFAGSRVLVPRRVQATLQQGEKACIELTLYDGRTLTCTPDHRLLVEDGQWLAARDVLQSGLKVAVGLRPPIEEDAGSSSSAAEAWHVQLGSLRLDLAEHRAQTLAFFRLLGYTITDGTIAWMDGQPAAHLSGGHEADMADILHDIELLTGTRPEYSPSHTLYQVSLSAVLARAFTAAGCQPGRRGEVVRPLPAVVLDAPLPIVRAFLAGYFGGDGHSIHLSHHSPAGALNGLGWSMSCQGKVAAAQAVLLQDQLGALLERCGLPAGDMVWSYHTAVTAVTAAGRREIRRRKLVGERLSSPVDLATVDDSVSVSIRLTMRRACVLPFSENIGFAYCWHKQLRLEAAATVHRTWLFALSQRGAVYSHFLTLSDGTFAQRVAAAKEAFAATTALHPSVQAWRLQQVSQIAAATTDIGFERGGYGGLQPKQLLAEWGALQFFSPPRKTPYSATAAAPAPLLPPPSPRPPLREKTTNNNSSSSSRTSRGRGRGRGRSNGSGSSGHNRRHHPDKVVVGPRGKRLHLQQARAAAAAAPMGAVLSGEAVERFQQVAELARYFECGRVADESLAHAVMDPFIFSSLAPATYSAAAAGASCDLLYQLHGPLSLEFGLDSDGERPLTFEVLEAAAAAAKVDFSSVLFSQLVPIVWEDWFDEELEPWLRMRGSVYAALSRASADAALQSGASVFVLFGGHPQEAYRELLLPAADAVVTVSAAVQYYTASAHGRTVTIVECPHPSEAEAYASVIVALRLARTLHAASTPVDVAALAALEASAAEDEPEWGREKVRWAVPRGMEGVPLFYLPVIGMREVGTRRVYDLSVPTEDDEEASFVADGVVTHNCIMIITSVVPPELPMELSLAVNTSLMQLAQQQIFCTEPFRIPLAGAVDVCCFDKTGTLTADEFKVSGIAGLGAADGLQPASDVADDVKFVIAGCHSLAHIAESGLVGDPLEKAALAAIRYSYSKAELAVSESGRQRVRILQRFAFTSVLKRMSCVVALDHDGNAPLRVVVKGAAEVIEPMLSVKPSWYTACHQLYARRGCRVLALAYRVLKQRDTPDDRRAMRDMRRDELETGLTFAGFLVLQCPLKPDSKDVVRHLMDSSHAVVMITGDNTLTACSVAAELSIVTRDVAILSHTADGAVVWLDADNAVVATLDRSFSPASLASLSSSRDLCVSGEAIEHLTHHERVTAAQLGLLIPFVKVFARFSPDLKELVLTRLKLAGKVTLMAGDGTNDVGALKQAHVGVALIGEEGEKKKREAEEAKAAKEGKEEKKAVAASPAPPALSLKPQSTVSKFQQAMQLTKKVQAEAAAAERASGRQWSMSERNGWVKRRFAEEMKELQGQAMADEPPPIRLGDASIASPFTSKLPYITSTVHIIRQGRCTLVTTLQMFAILGVNSLISAYAMSVLYLQGVKMADTQMTFAGLSIAMFFLFVSRSRPMDRLSAERPQSRIFTAHMMLNIMGQFALHMLTLLTAVQLSLPHTPTDADTKSPDTAFQPNVLNTVVYLVSTTATTATFIANYRGHPFMQSLRDNTWLHRALLANVLFVLLMASGAVQEVNDVMKLADMPSLTLRLQLMTLVLFDLCSTVLYANMLKRIFAIRRKKSRGAAADGPAVNGNTASRLKAE